MAWLTAWPRPCQADQTTKLLTASPTVESVEPQSPETRRRRVSRRRAKSAFTKRWLENSVSWGILYIYIYMCAPEYYDWNMVRILFLVSYYVVILCVFFGAPRWMITCSTKIQVSALSAWVFEIIVAFCSGNWGGLILVLQLLTRAFDCKAAKLLQCCMCWPGNEGASTDETWLLVTGTWLDYFSIYWEW